MERRLAAVLAVDMVGYSRLMGEDEQGTLAVFRRHRRDLFQALANLHRGRIIKLTGDGALIEFASVVESVSFAVAVQLTLRDENDGIPEERQHRYRIGINVSDIIPDEGDIYGDGVNLAARLEGLADPGGICLSVTAYDHLRGRLDLNFDDLGEKTVKNFPQPVRVYRIALDEKAERLASRPVATSTRRHVSFRRVVMLGGAMALCAAIAAAVWWLPPASWLGLREPPQRVAYPLPDKPSVAVLPFINVTGDEEQDHLAEGLTDDLITELSKVSGLFVIARHSVFALKGTAATIQDMASELGVHYVLEGTLQRAGEHLRINVKLIDALTGLSLWAERYDRQYVDLFAVQDDVIGKVISALSVKLSEGERDHLSKIPTDNLEAYDNYLRAEHEGFLYGNVASYRRALSFYQKAIDLDPNFAAAHAGIARIAVDVWRNDYNFLWSTAVARRIAYDAAGRALKLDPENARAHTVVALLQLVDGRSEEAVASARIAVEAQPSDAEAYANLALVLVHTGARREALEALAHAARLDPSPPPNFELLSGVVRYLAGEYGRARTMLERARDSLPGVEPVREFLGATYARLGEPELAGAEIAVLLQLFPEANLTYYGLLYSYWRTDELRLHLEALAMAGVGEWPFGFEGEIGHRLRGDEVAALTRGMTWTGRNEGGTTFVQYFDTSGATAYRSANTIVTGTSRIEGDSLCEKFPGYFLDRVTCGFVYRKSPESEGPNYIHVTPYGLRFFDATPT